MHVGRRLRARANGSFTAGVRVSGRAGAAVVVSTTAGRVRIANRFSIVARASACRSRSCRTRRLSAYGVMTNSGRCVTVAAWRLPRLRPVEFVVFSATLTRPLPVISDVTTTAV